MVVYKVSSYRRGFFENFSLTTKLIAFNTIFYFLVIFLIWLKVLKWDWIALVPKNVLDGRDVWTFLTSMFMHGSIIHLFVNMLSLFFVGAILERILGRKRYFWFYVLAGLFAGFVYVLVSYLFSTGLNVGAVGASGAIFGLIGILVLITPNLPVYLMFIPVPIKMKYAGPGILVLLWLFSLSFGASIGNTAHLGGLLAGLIYGWYLRWKFPNKTEFISRRFS